MFYLTVHLPLPTSGLVILARSSAELAQLLCQGQRAPLTTLRLRADFPLPLVGEKVGVGLCLGLHTIHG